MWRRTPLHASTGCLQLIAIPCAQLQGNAESGYLLLVCGLETYLPPPAIQPALLTQLLSGSKCKYSPIGMSIEVKYRSGILISKIRTEKKYVVQDDRQVWFIC